MTQGPVEETILRQAYRRGIPPPEVMANAPELRPELRVFWTAFERLSTCRRHIGMAGIPGPIPWTAIAEYAREYGFTGQSFHDLVTIISLVDEEYRTHVMKKAPQNVQSPGVQPPNGQTGGKGR